MPIPVAIVPAENDLDSFFADISTYHSQHSPITAYAYVFKESLSSALGLKGRKYNAPKIDATEAVLRILICLVLGEAASSVAKRGSADGVSYDSCRRTFSYALSRAYLLYPKMDLFSLLDRWTVVHELAGIENPPSTPGIVLRILRSAATASIESGDLLSDVLFNLAHGVSPGDLLPRIIAEIPEHETDMLELRGPFDRRMKAFQTIARALFTGKRDPDHTSMIIAYLANLISPGSFAYIELLQGMPYAEHSVVWYMVFSGLTGDQSIPSVGNGVGYKIARDLIAPFSLEERPSCDIALEELIVLSRLKLTRSMLKPQLPKELIVALMPGVNVYLRFPGLAGVNDERTFDSAAAAKDQKLRRVLMEALSILEENVDSTGASRRSVKRNFY